jgi:hypothetical protein
VTRPLRDALGEGLHDCPDTDTDADEPEDWEPSDDCGRWWDGRLTGSCSLAGTEQCDFECPYRSTLYRALAPPSLSLSITTKDKEARDE